MRQDKIKANEELLRIIQGKWSWLVFHCLEFFLVNPYLPHTEGAQKKKKKKNHMY